MTQAGVRDRLITIDQKSYTLDVLGGETITWTSLGSRWADVKPVRDSERFGAAEAVATITHRFTILWDATLWAALDATCRLTFESVVYSVVAVKEIGRREGIEISATARAD